MPGKNQMLGRHQLAAETLRHALDALAESVPDWLRAHATPAWLDCHALRGIGIPWPRRALLRNKWIADTADAMALRRLPALVTLRQVWVRNVMPEDLDDEHWVVWRASGHIRVAGEDD